MPICTGNKVDRWHPSRRIQTTGDVLRSSFSLQEEAREGRIQQIPPARALASGLVDASYDAFVFYCRPGVFSDLSQYDILVEGDVVYLIFLPVEKYIHVAKHWKATMRKMDTFPEEIAVYYGL